MSKVAHQVRDPKPINKHRGERRDETSLPLPSQFSTFFVFLPLTHNIIVFCVSVRNMRKEGERHGGEENKDIGAEVIRIQDGTN